MSAHVAPARSHTQTAQTKQLDFRIVYALVFIVFFSAALAHRLIPYRWRPQLVPDGVRRSVLQEALVATRSSIPFAFS